jgi:hypothetical protein
VIFVARGKGSLIVIVLVLLLVLDLLKVAAKGAWNLREALLPPSLAYVGEVSRFAGFSRSKAGRFAYIAFATGGSDAFQRHR